MKTKNRVELKNFNNFEFNSNKIKVENFYNYLPSNKLKNSLKIKKATFFITKRLSK